MVRTWAGLILICVLISLAAFQINKNAVQVMNGTYVFQQSGDGAVGLAYVIISDNDITFSYDPLSSYMPYGTYKAEDGILTMTTNDGDYKYVFRVDGKKLIFQKEKSSGVNLIDDRIGARLYDHAVFILREIQHD